MPDTHHQARHATTSRTTSACATAARSVRVLVAVAVLTAGIVAGVTAVTAATSPAAATVSAAPAAAAQAGELNKRPPTPDVNVLACVLLNALNVRASVTMDSTEDCVRAAAVAGEAIAPTRVQRLVQ